MVNCILFQKKKTGKIPARLNIGLMLFASCFVSYMLRVNMSINILSMVHHPEEHIVEEHQPEEIEEHNTTIVTANPDVSQLSISLYLKAIYLDI